VKAPYRFLSCALTVVASLSVLSRADASGDHEHSHETTEEMIETMRDMHAGHDHAHDFDSMEDISSEDMHRTMDLMADMGLILPPMDADRGRTAFLEKGCIVCHQVNGIGGAIGPALDAGSMPDRMNAFEFAARMWRGAPVMAEMQEDLLGSMISLTGQELADIVLFVHDSDAQAALSRDDIPDRYDALIIE
jgi:mono/diheme cytochrome c family protein